MRKLKESLDNYNTFIYDRHMDKKEIKELRDRLDLTQEQFARRLRVSFVTINRWEGGHARPSRVMSRRLRRLQEKADKSTQLEAK